VEEILQEGVERLREQGLEVEGRLASGKPTDAISACARELGADLIVVGHKRKGALARWWTGSVNYSLLAQAPCSILVAMQEAD
jgi:nucleotide-binding universal stress UspA family protein